MSVVAKGSFSVHFRTSPGIWPRAPPGAHLECPGSSFGAPRELICGRTGAHFLKIGAHVLVHGTARCAGSLRTRRSSTSQSPCSPSYLVMHAVPRSSFLGAQQLCSLHDLTELPLQASQVNSMYFSTCVFLCLLGVCVIPVYPIMIALRRRGMCIVYGTFQSDTMRDVDTSIYCLCRLGLRAPFLPSLMVCQSASSQPGRLEGDGERAPRDDCA